MIAIFNGSTPEAPLRAVLTWRWRRDKPQKEVSKNFFFEKKKQKTFASLMPGDVQTSRVKIEKVFCGAFLQKSDLLLAFTSLSYQPFL
jgi:hypothetical protein